MLAAAMIFAGLVVQDPNLYLPPPIPPKENHWTLPQPYIGFHVGADASRRRFSEDTRTREKMLKIGMPMAFYQVYDYGVDRLQVILWPELTVGNRLLGGSIGAGPEQVFDIGPSSAPLALVMGFQAGIHTSFIYNDDHIQDVWNQDMNTFKKISLAGVARGYSGVEFPCVEDTRFRVLIDIQFYVGKIAENTIRFRKSEEIGMTAGLDFQFLF
ncbi:MAG: hypothetical protein COV44_09925 [Deltaproteobacteria bacterium CG11_big_fil_rev_8_21_14_0_20_45_16]|nr:MAG: hypothetical protein COV44_09925 [Deltaproteobacteria bacterium CG11_big_fil_rev_8_21_14_0_20_45_16]